MNRRIAVCLVLLVCLPLAGSSQDDKEICIGPAKTVGGKKIYSFKVGEVGYVSKDLFRVSKIYLAEGGERDHGIISISTFRFMVVGASLKGLADGDTVTFTGTWEVNPPTLSDGRRYPTITAVPFTKAAITPK